MRRSRSMRKWSSGASESWINPASPSSPSEGAVESFRARGLKRFRHEPCNPLLTVAASGRAVVRGCRGAFFAIHCCLLFLFFSAESSGVEVALDVVARFNDFEARLPVGMGFFGIGNDMRADENEQLSAI